MQYSPVPSPEGTKSTYWETKAPGSEVLGIGAGVSSGTFITSSVISFIVGGFCTGQVRAMPLSSAFTSFAVPVVSHWVTLSRLFLEFRSPPPTSNAPLFGLLDTISTRVGGVPFFLRDRNRGKSCAHLDVSVWHYLSFPTTPFLHNFIPNTRLDTGNGGLV